jgi:hypothetical protein
LHLTFVEVEAAQKQHRVWLVVFYSKRQMMFYDNILGGAPVLVKAFLEF